MRLPRIATALAAVALSFTVVAAGPARPAAALGSAPITIAGGAVRAAPVVTTAVAGLCSTGVGCLALGAVGLGVTLYATQDTWMPWLIDQFNQGSVKVPGGAAVACAALAINEMDFRASDQTLNGKVTLPVTGPPCGPYGATFQTATANMADLTCWKPDGTYVSRLGFNAEVRIAASSAGTPQPVGFNLVGVSGGCLVGETVRTVSMQLNKTFSDGTVGKSDWWKFTTPVEVTKYITHTDVTCRRADGSTFTIPRRTVTGLTKQLDVPSCYALDPTSIPQSITVTSPNETTPLLDYTVPDWETQYPDCFGPSGLLCQIKVFVHNNPCEIGMESCQRWWDHRGDPARDYSCRFGPYPLTGFSMCEALKRAYRTGTQTQTITDPNVDPDTPWPNTDPEVPTDPEAPPTTGTNPLEPPVFNPEDPAADPESQSCWGQMWSWNPVDWVYVPVKCSLSWAFVPKTSLSARIDSIKGTLTGVAPFSWIAAVGSVPSFVPGGSCPDWNVTVMGTTKNVVCNSSYTDAIRSARPVLFGFMASLAFWPLIRSVMYASVPIIKPTPSGGGR